MHNNLSHFIEILEQKNELLRISSFVNPDLEIAEIADRFIKNNGKALLFENTGTQFPVLINAMGSEQRMCTVLGVNHLDEIQNDIQSLFTQATEPKNSLLDKMQMLPLLGKVASWLPKKKKGRGDCQQVVMPEPNLFKLPILKCWPCDGGKFITLPLVHTVDPYTQITNVGMYRMQVFDKNLTGMHWHLHKTGAKHYQAYKQMGKRMPVSVVLGGDPAYTYAATAPLPEGIDEYILAGFLRKRKVELVKCLTNDLYVPADADFVIEGYIDTAEDWILEGPFGDHTGFYSLPDYYPKFHVTCITHKKNAVYPATIVGIPPQEDVWMGKATERIFLAPIRLLLCPEVMDIAMPAEGVFHNLVLIKIKNDFAGQARKVMNALWGAGQMMFSKILMVFDEETDIHDYNSVAKAICENLTLPHDIYFSKGPADVLDHAATTFALGGKIGFDLCRKKVHSAKTSKETTLNDFQNIFPEIKSQKYISELQVLLLGIEKNKENQVRKLHADILTTLPVEQVRFVIYINHEVDIDDLPIVLWFVCNNIDPENDCYFMDNIPCMAVDGTAKTNQYDHFSRGEWPNVVVSSEETIQTVDARWESLKLGGFLSSPSLKYRRMSFGKEAKILR